MNEFVRLLRETKRLQIRGFYLEDFREGTLLTCGCCALGLALTELCGWNFDCDPDSIKIMLREKIGLTDAGRQRIAVMNDREELSFAQIADKIEAETEYFFKKKTRDQ